MRTLLISIYTLISLATYSQNRNNIWCFGDSAGIDFSNINNPIHIHSAVKSRGSCVSICDTNSNLLFYAYTRAALTGNTTLVKNMNDSLMLNGDNIVGRGWYKELVIIPYPDDTTKFYLFSVGATSIFGLYYSTIDMTLDSGLGAVTQKNIQLLPDPAVDGLTAVKHANGRDWWLFHRRSNPLNNLFYIYLVSPAGVNLFNTQNIGSQTSTNLISYVFNKTGDKLAMVMYDGIIETFDFDRCSGILSNHILIRPMNPSPPSPGLWSCAFSPNGMFLYVSAEGNPTSYLMQIDLQDSTPWANADTIWRDSIYIFFAGALKLAPDDKIYFSCNWNDGITYNFPYPDTLSNYVINNLSVINIPDSPGTACNFTPFSFYLGGNRTYLGLPNNPDYDLPRIQGSPCDTVQWMGINEQEATGNGQLYVTYVREWEKLFVNAQNIKGTKYTLLVYDMLGKMVHSESGKLQPPYFTRDLDCNSFSTGVYLVRLQTDKEMLVKRFVKE